MKPTLQKIIDPYKCALLQCTLFKDITESDVQKFMTQNETFLRIYNKNDLITLVDEPIEGLGIILKGHALLMRENMLGQRAIVTDLYESHMFGEALLFAPNPLWPATIRATEKTVVLFIPPQVFSPPLNNYSHIHVQLLLNLLTDMSQKTLQLNKKVHYLTIKSMRQKIFAYFRDLHKEQNSLHLHIPHTREEMADILNVSRPSMSRELGRLIKENIIFLHKNRLEILKPDIINLN